MASTIIEQHGLTFEIGENGSSAKLNYFVSGETDEEAVKSLALAKAPPAWNGFVRGEPVAKRRDGLDQWDIAVNYAPSL